MSEGSTENAEQELPPDGRETTVGARVTLE